MPTTLYLPPRHSDDSRLVWKAAYQAGWTTHRLAFGQITDDLPRTDVAFYGEWLFAALLAEKLRLKFMEPAADCLPSLPVAYAKRKITLTTLGAAKHLTETAFIKPANDKAFPAKPYAPGALATHAQAFDDAMPVLISELVDFRSEYRLFISDRAIVTSSLYFKDDALVQRTDGSWPRFPDEETAAHAFATQVLADANVFLPPAVVLDVGYTADRGWCVIECNACWGSGLYGADPAKILPLLRRACVRQEDAAREDPRCFVQR